MKDAGLYIATVLIWGCSWIGILYQVDAGVEAPHAIIYRFGGAALIIFAFLVLAGRSARAPLRAHALFFAMGFFMFTMNYSLVYEAVRLGLTTALAAVVYSLLILMNALNAAIFFGQRPNRGAMLAAPLGLAGMICLFWTEIGGLLTGADDGSGAKLLYCLGAVYCASLGNMASRKLQGQGWNVTMANGWAMGYGALALLAWALATGGPLTFSTEPGFVVSLALLVVFSTVIAFWTYLTLLGRIGADRAAYAFVAFPVVALGISSLFEGLVWTDMKIAGVGLILAGNLALLIGGAGRRARPA